MLMFSILIFAPNREWRLRLFGLQKLSFEATIKTALCRWWAFPKKSSTLIFSALHCHRMSFKVNTFTCTHSVLWIFRIQFAEGGDLCKWEIRIQTSKRKNGELETSPRRPLSLRQFSCSRYAGQWSNMRSREEVWWLRLLPWANMQSQKPTSKNLWIQPAVSKR